MSPVEKRVCCVATALGTTGVLAVWGAIDLAAYAYRLHRGLRNTLT